LRGRCARRPPPGGDPLVARAFDAVTDWAGRPRLDDVFAAELTPVFGLGDGNLANYLWDGARVRVVDFEYSGLSDRAYELAEVVEHISVWVDDGLDAPALLSRFELTPAETARLRECRRLLALFWFLSVLSDDPEHPRNPPGTAVRQAGRLLALLGA
ncbi:phosphotransferase family protein, partial [Actinoallomurus acaciae]